MITQPRTLAVTFAAILTLPACSDIAGLGDSSGIVGAFVLQTVEGEPLPVRGRLSPELISSTEILADTIVLIDRAWERSRHIRSGDLDGEAEGESLTWEQETAGPITRLEDGRFMLGIAGCDDTGDCLPNEIFSARGDTLFIAESSDFLFRDLRFVRMPR